MRKTIALVSAAALVAGAFLAAPAEAAKKKKKPPCAPYTSTVEGAESATTTSLTAAATAEAPVEVKIEAPAGVPEVAVEHVFHNVQVTSATPTGLFARYEFPSYEDYDLYLLDSAGEEVARSAGFNQTPYGPFDGTGSGGHSETGAENIDGAAITKCAGYTIDMASYMGEGGELTLKLWLGDPAPAE